MVLAFDKVAQCFLVFPPDLGFVPAAQRGFSPQGSEQAMRERDDKFGMTNIRASTAAPVCGM